MVYTDCVPRQQQFYVAYNKQEVGTAQWLEHRTHDRKVPGLSPRRSGGRIFFSVVNFLWLLLFWYTFYPCVTAVARKRWQQSHMAPAMQQPNCAVTVSGY